MIVSTAKDFGAAIRARRKELGKALYLVNLLGLDAELRKRGELG